MKLFYHCNYCEANFTLPYTAANRQELAQMTGEQLKARCPLCGAFHDVHVNEIKARPRRKRYVLTPLSVVATAAFLYWFWQVYWQPSDISAQSMLPASGVLLMIGGALFLAWRYFEKRSASAFNHRHYNHRSMRESQ